MPAVSQAQQRLMGAAEHGAHFPAAEKIRASTTHRQMHEFATGPEKGKPEHAAKSAEKSHRMKLHGHALRHGHGGGRGEAYVDGAMAERGGGHTHTGQHTNALMHAASGHGWNGPHAEAYAHGAENERAGMHGSDAEMA